MKAFAQGRPEASAGGKAPSPHFPGKPPLPFYASPYSDLSSLDLRSLGFKIPVATAELFIVFLPFLLRPQLKGGL